VLVRRSAWGLARSDTPAMAPESRGYEGGFGEDPGTWCGRVLVVAGSASSPVGMPTHSRSNYLIIKLRLVEASHANIFAVELPALRSLASRKSAHFGQGAGARAICRSHEGCPV